MEFDKEKKRGWGGARYGSGRKKTGLLTKHYTISLPLDVAEAMEKRAAQMNITVNKYLRMIIEKSGQYDHVSVNENHVDEEVTAYDRNN